MKSFSVLSLFFIILLTLAQPASAGAVDTSIQVVSSGIESYFEHKELESFERNFGVTFGNTSEMDRLTPAQKIVYMIAAAEHHPLEVQWVREEFASDFVWYYYAVFMVSLITGGMCLLQKTAPETIAGISNRFTGHDGAFDYYIWFETMMFLGFLPVIALPLIQGIMEIEQVISSGMMHNAMEFLNLNSGVTGAIFFFEGFTYTSCGAFFAARIQFINQFTANIMKIIFLFSISWLGSRGVAKIMVEWFISALFMRPIVLFYSSKAVEHIGSFDTQYGITPDMNPRQAYAQVWSTTADVAGAIAIDMSLVLICSTITAAVLILWPVIKFLIDVVMKKLGNVIYKVAKANYLLNKVRRT